MENSAQNTLAYDEIKQIFVNVPDEELLECWNNYCILTNKPIDIIFKMSARDETDEFDHLDEDDDYFQMKGNEKYESFSSLRAYVNIESLTEYASESDANFLKLYSDLSKPLRSLVAYRQGQNWIATSDNFSIQLHYSIKTKQDVVNWFKERQNNHEFENYVLSFS